MAVTAGTLSYAANRLAMLLNGEGEPSASATDGDLIFESDMAPRPLARTRDPQPDIWAVDGGQAMVADARCLGVYVARAGWVCFSDGACIVEEQGELRVWLLGGAEDRVAAASLGLGIHADCAVDVNLLRDHEEWQAVRLCIERACPGSVVLIDGDLQPDWRIPAPLLAGVLAEAAAAGIVLAGVVKRSGLAHRGAPLVGHLEGWAHETLGVRQRWWAPVARTRGEAGTARRVVVARLDPDARYAFRIDLPEADDQTVEQILGTLAAVSDDAAYPGYPYPLSVADRLAACPPGLRAEAGYTLDELLADAGVSAQVRERTFADRHSLMERF